MEKLIAFNVYVRTPSGSYHTAVVGDEAKDVYLASEVDARIDELENALRSVVDAYYEPESDRLEGSIDEASRVLMER
jgi:hypothetical protein